MIRNYFKTALRSILNKKIYSIINLLGLSVGIACSLLIFIFIHFELNFDQFHTKKDRIHRISSQFSFGDVNMTTAMSPSAVLPTLLDEFPEVKSGVRVFRAFRPEVIKVNGNQFQESEIFYADSTFFNVFDFELVSGNSEKALTEPNSIIFTERSAIKYFGTTDIINKEVEVNGRNSLITAVAKNPPNNTHLRFDFIQSLVTAKWASGPVQWGSANFFTFFVLNENTNLIETQRKLNIVVEREMGPFDGPNMVKMSFISLNDIHLRSEVADELQKGDITYVYIFSFIAGLIVLIACVNYMNLATARSVSRAKEVGVRKVLGAHRPQLFIQFIIESALMTGTAIILAMVLANVTLPLFSEIAGQPLSNSLLFNPMFILGLILFWLIVSFLAGTYPALILSSFSPGTVLKSGFKNSGKGAFLRRILVVFQFAVSMFLFIGSIVIYQQLSYMQTKKLGYEKDNLIILPADLSTQESFNSFKAELMRIPEVTNVAMANESLSQVRGGYDIKVEGVNQQEGMLTTAMIVSQDFVKTAGLEIVAGEDFNNTDEIQSNLEEPVQNVLINEEAAKFLYLTPQESIGLNSDLNGRVGQIKGVIKNFHFRSLKEKIQPIVLFIEPGSLSQTLVNVNTKDPFRTIENLKNVWESSFTHRPFEYKFLDQEYDAMYHAEEQLKQVYSLFTALAIFIGCLGLFGLVSYSTIQRSKEIGIRKILGATINSIVGLISLDFLKLVFLGFLVATPIAYWSMNNWLAGFEYRIDFSWTIVGLTLVAQVLLAIFVTSWQSVKAAIANPVEAIRNE